MKRFHYLLLLLSVFFLLPGFALAQKHVITRPTKPKTERRTAPKPKPAPHKPKPATPKPPKVRTLTEEDCRQVVADLVGNMVSVTGGTFMMGATPEQGDDIWNDERPVHQVTLSDFSIGRFEVTQLQWRAVMGSNPSSFIGDDLPVDNVTWDDCQTFIQRLNSLTGRWFRLPTEAEWEFAARGGNQSRGRKYAGSNSADDVAWYEDNSGSRTHPVGTKRPNELGLYDMSGNVWEWCQDWDGDYSSMDQTNPQGVRSGEYRVFRGGSWDRSARYCRVACRNHNAPNYSNNNFGLRLAM